MDIELDSRWHNRIDKHDCHRLDRLGISPAGCGSWFPSRLSFHTIRKTPVLLDGKPLGVMCFGDHKLRSGFIFYFSRDEHTSGNRRNTDSKATRDTEISGQHSPIKANNTPPLRGIYCDISSSALEYVNKYAILRICIVGRRSLEPEPHFLEGGRGVF